MTLQIMQMGAFFSIVPVGPELLFITQGCSGKICTSQSWAERKGLNLFMQPNTVMDKSAHGRDELRRVV